jgi:hypothetical protein
MKKRVIIVTMLLAVSMLFLLGNLSKAQKKVDLFNDILKTTDGKTVEYGVTVIFTSDKNGEAISDDILKKLGFYDGWNTNVLNSRNAYCVEFGKDNVDGYIESTQYENHNIVTVNIIKKDNFNNLDEMKDRLEKIISDYKVNAKYFQYLKAKLPNNNIKYNNNKVLELLKGYDSTNINTVKLENGYSTTAYTKMYDSMESNGQLIDLNYALSKYSSGSYIIIGTPEINVTY